MNQLFIPTDKGIRVVMARNIIRIEALSNYSKIYFDNEKTLTVAKVLQWFEETLPHDIFCRIHRTHIVNKMFIASLSYDNKVTLKNGEQLQISRRKKNLVRERVTIGVNSIQAI